MLIAGLLFLLLPLGSSQGYLSIKSSIDKTKITVGDPITYTLTVTREESVKVQLPELGANLGGFEIRDYSLNPGRRLKDGRIQDRVDYVIAIYETGEYEIPPVEVGYTLPNGEKGKLSSQPIKIWVESVKPSDAKDIRGIKDPVSIGFDWKPYYKWGGLILLFVGAGSYLWWRRRRGGITEEGIEYRGPPLPAHLIAFGKGKESTRRGKKDSKSSRVKRPSSCLLTPTYSPRSVSTTTSSSTPTPCCWAKPSAALVGRPSGSKATFFGGPSFRVSKGLCRSLSLASRARRRGVPRALRPSPSTRSSSIQRENRPFSSSRAWGRR